MEVDAVSPKLTRISLRAVLLYGCFVLCLGSLAYGPMAESARHLDFRSFYTGGYLARRSPALLYDVAAQKRAADVLVSPAAGVLPFYHPSYEALLYAPLSFVSYRLAYAIYMAWNLSLVGLCCLVAPPVQSATLRKLPRLPLFLTFLPVWICLLQGQNSILFLFMMCLCWRCLYSGERSRGAALLALGLFKLQLALLIALLLSARRSTRSVSDFLVIGLAVALTCLALAGLHGTGQFLHLVSMASLASDNSANAQTSMAVPAQAMPSLYGFLYLCGAHALSAKAAFALNATLSLMLLVVCTYLMLRVVHDSTAFSVAILGALILGQHLLLHDLTLLLLPILLLRGRALPWITVLCYVTPYLLFAFAGARWFSVAAILPVLLLGSCLCDLRGKRARHEAVLLTL